MYIFKTSGETFESVIKNQKHAYPNKPKAWFEGEIVLVSKNKNTCYHGEKQIQYVMRILDIRQAEDDEIEEYWPGNRGRWKWIIDCYDTIKLNKPFDLDVLTNPTKNYLGAQLYTRIDYEDELELMKYLDDESVFLQTPIEEDKKIIVKELQKLNALFENAEPEKKKISSQRIERNLRIVTLLKKIHPKKCQICSVEHFSTKNGEKYCEVHHIVELSKGGFQATDNCLVLCATCHRKLHHANVLLENNGSERIIITVNGTVFDVKRNISPGWAD